MIQSSLFGKASASIERSEAIPKASHPGTVSREQFLCVPQRFAFRAFHVARDRVRWWRIPDSIAYPRALLRYRGCLIC